MAKKLSQPLTQEQIYDLLDVGDEVWVYTNSGLECTPYVVEEEDLDTEDAACDGRYLRSVVDGRLLSFEALWDNMPEWEVKRVV